MPETARGTDGPKHQQNRRAPRQSRRTASLTRHSRSRVVGGACSTLTCAARRLLAAVATAAPDFWIALRLYSVPSQRLRALPRKNAGEERNENEKTNPLRASRAVVPRLGEGPRITQTNPPKHRDPSLRSGRPLGHASRSITRTNPTSSARSENYKKQTHFADQENGSRNALKSFRNRGERKEKLMAKNPTSRRTAQ